MNRFDGPGVQVTTDAFSASGGDALSEARINRLAKASLEAMEADDVAALSQRNANATLAAATARMEAAKAALALETAELGDVRRRFDDAKAAFDAAANAEREARRSAAPAGGPIGLSSEKTGLSASCS